MIWLSEWVIWMYPAFYLFRALQHAWQWHPLQSVLLLVHTADSWWDMASWILFHWYSYVDFHIPSVNYCNHWHCCCFPFQRLFVHTKRLTEEIKVYLNSSCNLSHCVQLYEYETVREYLKRYLMEFSVRVWVGTEYTNQALYELITPEVRPGYGCV